MTVPQADDFLLLLVSQRMVSVLRMNRDEIVEENKDIMEIWDVDVDARIHSEQVDAFGNLLAESIENSEGGYAFVNEDRDGLQDFEKPLVGLQRK